MQSVFRNLPDPAINKVQAHDGTQVPNLQNKTWLLDSPQGWKT